MSCLAGVSIAGYRAWLENSFMSSGSSFFYARMVTMVKFHERMISDQARSHKS